MLLHTEYSLLSLLKQHDGVIHHHGLFQVRLVQSIGFNIDMIFFVSGNKDI